MASNYNRKSASSGSRRAPSPSRATPVRAGSRPRTGFARAGAGRASDARVPSRASGYRAVPGGRAPGAASRSPLSSVRVGDLDRIERAQRAQRTYRRRLVRVGAAALVLLALAVGGVAVYFSSLFTIESVSVKGVEHLTAEDMQNMAGVPAGTTLLRVDAAGIRDNLLKNAWVQDVSVNRVFPDTLELAVTERTIEAVVEVPAENAGTTNVWAIASDGMWLMPIPDQDSEAGRRTSPKVYEDAASVLRITDVPYGTKPEIGAYCTDANVNNALDIVSGMTTELAGRVTAVKATETESTTLTIKDGPDIVFGTADDIREKERVCLAIMEEHPDGVSYINVRTVDRPTWRAL
ncbi:MAG TPA: FtsQ-type POTRA domain-containing protein [Candidatus Rubneribacter avistercoris]|nr:FtsQ-type POTRA domain-containing protein [Candidatus Rubneribacter avistercoris]